MALWYTFYQIDVGVEWCRDSRAIVYVTTFSGQLLNLTKARHQISTTFVRFKDAKTVLIQALPKILTNSINMGHDQTTWRCW